MPSDLVIQTYINLLPYAGYVFIASFLLTPIVGYIAIKLNIIDLPAIKRKRTDKSLAQRIHKKTKPRLGGLAYLLPMLFILLTQVQYNQQILGLVIGLTILLIFGSLDDKYELSAKTQMISQFLAALVVVILGTKIVGIDLAGLNLNFEWWEASFDIINITLHFVFPADLITIIWILVIINALNWMYGMDSIGEAMTIIASVTTALLSVKAGLNDFAIIALCLGGGIMGFLPYNYYPSKIIGGTVGSAGNGFLLATLSILSGAKFSNAIMLLIFPLFDMMWVIIYRLNKHREYPFLRRPFISGKVHFHHRLMTLGLSQRQILFVETIIISLISILGIYMSGFSNTFVFLIISIASLLIIFSLVSIYVRRQEGKMIQEIKKTSEKIEKTTDDDDDVPPEEKYAY